MILILSSELDYSTNEVIKWLRYQEKKYFRINETDKISIKYIDFIRNEMNVVFQVNNKEILHTKNISSYWYRRGGLSYDTSMFDIVKLPSEIFKNVVLNNIKYDTEILISFLIYVIESKKKISSINTAINNKLIHLSIAQGLNIKVPFTKIVSNKSDLKKYVQLKGKIITKCISDGVQFTESKKHYAIYTQSISENTIAGLTENFAPILIQEEIIKKWELRIFYLKGVFYSMAIFSQNDSKTALDFRKYNNEKPNYRIPYNLPTQLQNKLRSFMQKIELDTGSIDMLYDKDGNYYFLEVNPIGQFGMVSHPCNYNLEKEIASNL